MRKITQGGSSYISVKARNSADDAGLIMRSLRARETEVQALALAIPLNTDKDFITDKPPTPDHAWCSMGHWSKKSTFGMVKGLPDRYCRSCRADQQQKWRETKRDVKRDA